MDDMDEVSSTTKGVGDTTTDDVTAGTGAPNPAITTVGDGEEQSQSNARKRKSLASDEETGDVVSGSAPLPCSSSTAVAETARDVATASVSCMDVDESTGGDEAESSSTPPSGRSPEPEVEVDLRVTYNKDPIPVRISLKRTVGDLKSMIEAVTKVPPGFQKVLVKGQPKDDVVLESLGLSAGSKVMVIGTKLDDVLKVTTAPTAAELKGDDGPSDSTPSATNWCSVPRHQKVIDKGVPEDVMPGILDCQDPLPDFPISGMVNGKGSKVRLTIKLESDELWIGTKERTEKVPVGSIRNIVSQPISGFEHYHILAIQLGPTEASRYFIYWFPAQYIQALKDALTQ